MTRGSCSEILRRAGHADFAGLEYIGAMGRLERGLCVLFDQQDRGLLFGVESLDNVEDFFDQERGQPHRRLVQQHDARLLHERAANGQHLLLAARKGAALLEHTLFETREEGEDVLDTALEFAAVVDQIRAHLQVFEHSQHRKDAAAFGYMADAHLDEFVGRHCRQRLPLQSDFAAARAQDAGDCAQRGAFAGAVTADEGDDFTFVDFEGYTLERVDLTVVAVNFVQFEQRGCHA